MKIEHQNLIEDLIARTKENMNEANRFLQLSTTNLNWKENPEKWSVLECLEHLNRYGDFYLPEIENRISAAERIDTNKLFKSGILGNYFAKSMIPKEKLNTMKTFKSMNPVGSNLDKSVVSKFIAQQKETLNLLEKARRVDLNKVKTSISISSLIKLKLGDTFRVVIYHNQRHIGQANKVLIQQNA